MHVQSCSCYWAECESPSHTCQELNKANIKHLNIHCPLSLGAVNETEWGRGERAASQGPFINVYLIHILETGYFIKSKIANVGFLLPS